MFNILGYFFNIITNNPRGILRINVIILYYISMTYCIYYYIAGRTQRRENTNNVASKQYHSNTM